MIYYMYHITDYTKKKANELNVTVKPHLWALNRYKILALRYNAVITTL